MSKVFEGEYLGAIGNDGSAWLLMVAIDDLRKPYIKVPSPDQEQESKHDYQTRIIHRGLSNCSAFSYQRKQKVIGMHNGSRYLVHRVSTHLSSVLKITTW